MNIVDLKYECTPPRTKVEELFALCVSFRRAAKLCYNLFLVGRSVHLLAPMTANTALAAELALKCLLQMRKGRFAWTHDLYRLYSELPKEDQVALDDAYRSRRDSPAYTLIFKIPEVYVPKNYSEAVRHNKQAFENFRYPDEENKRKTSALQMLLDVTINYLLYIHVDLNKFALETVDPHESEDGVYLNCSVAEIK